MDIVTVRVKATDIAKTITAASICNVCGDKEFVVACPICLSVYCVLHEKSCACFIST